MNMTELKQYMIDNKRIKVAQWNKDRQGNHCQGFTQKSLNSLWKLIELNLERVEPTLKAITGILMILKTESFLQSKYEYKWII